MKTKNYFMQICLILIYGIQNLVFGQLMTGPTSNLCPGVLYTYTSPAGCSDPYGWTCLGCVPGTLNSAYNIINVGTNPDGTVYAKVAWDNATTAGAFKIKNICDSLYVFTNSIQITSHSTVCSTGTFSATLINPNPNQSIIWSSDNTGLSIDSSTGYAYRLNGYSGGANITATYVCGTNYSSSQSTPVWVGSPKPSSLSKNINSPPFCSGTEKSVSIAPEIGATSYTWASSNPSILLVEGNGNYALLDAGYSGTCYFTVTITNNCGTTSQNYIAVVSDCSGGGGEELLVYPNPASTTMTVSVTDSLSSNKSEVLPQSYHLTVFNRFGNSVFSVQSDQCTLQVPVSSLPLGIYCINVFYKDAVLSKQVMISK